MIIYDLAIFADLSSENIAFKERFDWNNHYAFQDRILFYKKSWTNTWYLYTTDDSFIIII